MSDYAAYLATWAQDDTDERWPGLADDAKKTEEGIVVVDEWWNVHSKAIVPGNRIFLLKQGGEQTGIMAAGYARSDSKNKRPHWEKQKRTTGMEVRFVDVDWKTILNPATEPLLQESAIHTGGLPERLWNARNSGNAIDDIVAHRIEKLWLEHVESVRGFEPLVGFTDEAEFPEGKEVWRLHRSHERHPDLPKCAKAAAIKRGEKIVCTICRFDFFAKYGEIGKEYIECHHTIPVSKLKEGMKTKLKDVVLVCSNCHRMLDRKRPWLAVHELNALLTK